MRLIDADALLKKIAHHTMFDCLQRVTFESANVYERVKGAMFELAQKAPAVDAAPVVHARWERHDEDWRNQIVGNECSACGFVLYGPAGHYCPRCGAKMDGGASDG